MTAAVIYFARNPDNGLVKIGQSTNVKARLRALKVQVGSELTLLDRFITTSASFYYEAAAHHFCSDQHVTGEWFKLSDEQISKAIIHLSGLTVPEDRRFWPKSPAWKRSRGYSAKKPVFIGFRMTPEEGEFVKRMAKAAKLDVSKWIRLMVFGSRSNEKKTA